MVGSFVFRVATVVGGVAFLTGCGGGGQDNGLMIPTAPLPVPTAESFLAGYDAGLATPDTLTPLTGQATFSGYSRILSVGTTGPSGEVYADVNLLIDFENADRPVSGTVTNFSGTLGGGAVSGSLTTENPRLDGSDARNTIFPAFGGGTAVQFDMTGAISVDGATPQTLGLELFYGGVVRGDGGATLAGTGASTAQLPDDSIVTFGRHDFYINRND